MTQSLSLDGVHAGYGASRVLNGVDLTIAGGERIALLGRNGAGKTTVVNTLYGMARLHSGCIRVNGRDLKPSRTFSAARAGVSAVPQGRRILPNLSVQENLELGAATRRKGRWSLAEVYRLFPILKDRASQRGTALSGGQQQMLAIGRALMANPTILILDEPSEGLAPVVIDELAEVFVRLAEEEGIGLLLIEQTVHLVQRVAKRCHILSKGKIVESRDVSEWTKAEMQSHISV